MLLPIRAWLVQNHWRHGPGLSSGISEFSQRPIGRSTSAKHALTKLRRGVARRQHVCGNIYDLQNSPFRVHIVAGNIKASDAWLCNLAQLEPPEAGTMNPRASATVAAAFYPTVVIAGWAVVSLAGMGSPRIETSPPVETSGVAQVVDRVAPSLAANIELAAAPQVIATAAPQMMTISNATPAVAEVATDNAEAATTDQVMAKPITDTTAAPDKPQPIIVAALTDPAESLPPEVQPAQTPTASTADAPPQEAATPADRIEIVGECIVVDACIDQYLWALYQRTPKEDTINESELRKVTVKRKGKMVTVTRSFSKQVDNDFAWKDPKAAERVGMSMIDYVIGGMDRSFKIKLFHALHAAEAAGLQPGITSAFRDDYRQSIASGLKAASNRSYHGGSLRGGYGHGMAADIVSVNGANRAQRWTSTEILWKWVDANGKQYGIGRPYLGHDPPHVGPIDGLEYVSKRGGTRLASTDVKKRDRQAAHAAATKRTVAARSSSSKPASRLAAVR
jgi:hypothetical protein